MVSDLLSLTRLEQNGLREKFALIVTNGLAGPPMHEIVPNDKQIRFVFLFVIGIETFRHSYGERMSAPKKSRHKSKENLDFEPHETYIRFEGI